MVATAGLLFVLSITRIVQSRNGSLNIMGFSWNLYCKHPFVPGACLASGFNVIWRSVFAGHRQFAAKRSWTNHIWLAL